MYGGAGNDQYVIRSAGSSIGEGANGGLDTAWVTVNGYSVGSYVEITRLAGTATQIFGAETDDQVVANPLFGSVADGRGGNDVLWGSGFGDILSGGAGDDIIRGQGGEDWMYGGTGNDQFVVLDPGVQILENAGEDYDTAWIGLAADTLFVLADQVERGNLSGLANIVIGNASDNVLVGDAVACTLSGQGGNDMLFGSALADTLTGGTGDDIIYAGGGADLIVFEAGGYGLNQIAGFSQADGARLDFRGSGIQAADLAFSYGSGNTQVNHYGVPGDIILVFGVTLTQADFLFS